MIDEFIVRAGIAGLGVALAAGPLGCFVVWRKMAYFGDATAHASILGVALGLATGVPIFASVMLAAMAMALIVALLSGRAFAADTLLGVSAHTALALGLVVVSLLPNVRLDLMSYLFGDILSVGWADVALIWGGAGVICALLMMQWRALLTATLSPELAAAQGQSPVRRQLTLMLTLAVLVAVALKVVGALLITAMLILPAAGARALARTPEAMALGAVILGMLASIGGLALSLAKDTPTGPSIVITASALLVICLLANRLIHRSA